VRLAGFGGCAAITLAAAFLRASHRDA